MALSQQTRLQRIEQVLIQQMIGEALDRARQGPRASFAATLLRWLPGDSGHVHLDWDALTTEELQLLAEAKG
jgi:hypothetical protein